MVLESQKLTQAQIQVGKSHIRKNSPKLNAKLIQEAISHQLHAATKTLGKNHYTLILFLYTSLSIWPWLLLEMGHSIRWIFSLTMSGHEYVPMYKFA